MSPLVAPTAFRMPISRVRSVTEIIITAITPIPPTSNATDDNTIITNNGAAAEGLRVVSFPTGTKAFKQDLLNEYHVTEQLYSAPESYDAFKTIYLAVQKGATTGEQFHSIIPTIDFDGASSHIKFDKYGEIPYQTYKYDLLEVKDGAFALVTQ